MENRGEETFRNKISMISFILCFFVISIHTYNVDTYGLTRESLGVGSFVFIFEKVMFALEKMCVPFFFMISGYLFFRTFSLDKTWEKYNSRIRTVIVPYLLWCSIYYLAFAVSGKIAFVNQYLNSTVELSFQEWVMSLWVKEYYTLWFLKSLIFMIIISPLMYLILKNYKRHWTGLIAIAIIYVLLKFNLLDSSLMSIYYVIGAYIGINYKEIPKKNGKKRILISLGMFALSVIAHLWFSLNGYTDDYIVITIMICTCWYAADFFEFNKPTKWWMEITFFIYCAHDLILELSEKIFFKIFGSSSIYALIDYLLMPIFVVGICIVLAAVIKKVLPKLWGIVTGNRG